MAAFFYKTSSGVQLPIAGQPVLIQQQLDNIADVQNKIAKTSINTAGTGGVAGYDDTQIKLGSKVDRTNVFQVTAYRAVGGATDQSAIEAAVAAAKLVKGIVDFGHGTTWTLTNKLDLPLGTITYTGSSVSIDCSAVPDSAGYAINFIPASTANIPNTYNNWCEGIRFIGPASESRNLDGVFIGRPSTMSGGDVAGYSFRNIVVQGFRDNWFFGDQSWCLQYWACSSRAAWRRGYNIDGQVNAGENYNFHAGVVDGCTNSSFTGVGVYTSAAGASDVNFFGTSFDYCDIEISHNSAVMTLTGCHLEDRANNGNPMVKLTSTGGLDYTVLNIIGGQVSPTETTPANGRAYLIETNGAQIRVNYIGTKWNTYNRKTDLVKGIGGTSPSLTWNGGDIGIGPAPNIAHISDVANVWCDPSLESGTQGTGWNRATGGVLTFSVQTATVNSGTYALKMAATAGTGSGNTYQVFPIAPFEEVIFTAELAADTMVAGSVIPRIQWLGPDMSVLSTSTFPGVSANQTFSRFGGKVVSPSGAAFMSCQLYAQNLNGNVYIDDVYVSPMRAATGGAGWVFGTSAGQITQGNDTRVVNAAQKVSAIDLEITDATKGVILLSPGGTRYRLTVANGGSPVFTAL